MAWKKLHREYALKKKLCPAAIALWEYFLRLGKEGEEFQPDLLNFNKWVAKHRGKPYHPKTIRSAMESLMDAHIIQGRKFGSWRYWDFYLTTIEHLICTKKTPPKQEEISHDQNSEQRNHADLPKTGFIQQQQSIKVDSECVNQLSNQLKEFGFNFGQKELARLVHYGVDKIKAALHLFFLRGGHEKIFNPPGWLTQCLRSGWWEDQQYYLGMIEPFISREEGFALLVKQFGS